MEGTGCLDGEWFQGIIGSSCDWNVNGPLQNEVCAKHLNITGDVLIKWATGYLVQIGKCRIWFFLVLEQERYYSSRRCWNRKQHYSHKLCEKSINTSVLKTLLTITVSPLPNRRIGTVTDTRGTCQCAVILTCTNARLWSNENNRCQS